MMQSFYQYTCNIMVRYLVIIIPLLHISASFRKIGSATQKNYIRFLGNSVAAHKGLTDTWTIAQRNSDSNLALSSGRLFLHCQHSKNLWCHQQHTPGNEASLKVVAWGHTVCHVATSSQEKVFWGAKSCFLTARWARSRWSMGNLRLLRVSDHGDMNAPRWLL